MDETTRQATRQWALAQPAVSAFITSVVRDFRDRDDVLQDVAVAVIESFNSYDPDYPFVAWAIGVARNQVRLYLRGRRRNRLVFDDETVAALAMAVTEVMPEATPQMDYLHDCIDLVEGRASLLLELRYRNDLPRFNRDLPGHECSLPINNLHDGLDALRTAYDLTLLPALTTDSVDDPPRRMVAVKKPGYRGPAEVEITYDSANGQIRKMRFVAMPYGVDNVTLTMTLVAERELPANHFDHQTHHAPLRRVEFE